MATTLDEVIIWDAPVINTGGCYDTNTGAYTGTLPPHPPPPPNSGLFLDHPRDIIILFGDNFFFKGVFSLREWSLFTAGGGAVQIWKSRALKICPQPSRNSYLFAPPGSFALKFCPLSHQCQYIYMWIYLKSWSVLHIMPKWPITLGTLAKVVVSMSNMIRRISIYRP